MMWEKTKRGEEAGEAEESSSSFIYRKIFFHGSRSYVISRNIRGVLFNRSLKLNESRLSRL
jgi:hypothetical protein